MLLSVPLLNSQSLLTQCVSVRKRESVENWGNTKHAKEGKRMTSTAFRISDCMGIFPTFLRLVFFFVVGTDYGLLGFFLGLKRGQVPEARRYMIEIQRQGPGVGNTLCLETVPCAFIHIVASLWKIIVGMPAAVLATCCR